MRAVLRWRRGAKARGIGPLTAWKLFGSTFLAILLAEMGDKTQLATMTLAAGSSRWVVFGGAAMALVASTAIAVLVGEGISRLVPTAWMHRAAGVVFVLIGVLLLLGRE